MKLRFIIAALFGAILCGSTQAIVFVTHGFNASHTPWYQPGGDFYEALKLSAAKQGHEVRHFTWNQKYGLGFTLKEHRAAGLRLASEIIDFCTTYKHNSEFPNNDEVIVVAHSYGGLVSYHASHGLENFLHQIDKEKESLYSGFTGWFKKAWHTLAQNWQTTQPRPVINKLFTLGTPHQETDVVPSAAGVRKIYNVYSSADRVASDLGAGNPLLPTSLQRHHKDACNVLLLGQTNQTTLGFGHSEIHHSLVGQEIFNIGEYVDITHAQDDHRLVYTIEVPEKLVTIAPAGNSTMTCDGFFAAIEKLGATIDWQALGSFDWHTLAQKTYAPAPANCRMEAAHDHPIETTTLESSKMKCDTHPVIIQGSTKGRRSGRIHSIEPRRKKNVVSAKTKEDPCC